MNENDYIAEYVKEKHSSILGVDYAMWKFAKQMTNAAQTMVNAFKSIDWSEVDLKDKEQTNETDN